MRLRLAVAVFAVVALGACGRPDGVKVAYKGMTPTNSKAADNRSVEFLCPGCGKVVDAGSPKCKACGSKVGWEGELPCGYCNGTGECPTCITMKQTKGECYDCQGRGYHTMAGRTPTCQNCGGGKMCPICKGTRKCDLCGGSGKVSVDVLKTKVRGAEEQPAQ